MGISSHPISETPTDHRPSVQAAMEAIVAPIAGDDGGAAGGSPWMVAKSEKPPKGWLGMIGCLNHCFSTGDSDLFHPQISLDVHMIHKRGDPNLG